MTPPPSVGHGDHRVVLDVELLLVADAVLALDDEVGGGERRVDVRRASMRYAANAWSDASGSKAGGSGVVRGRARRRASRSVAGRVRRGAPAARRGAGSPRRSGTRIGWSALIELTMFSPGMSAAVTTTTFDQSKPGSRSRATKVACASVERIVAPYQAPGTTMSSVYSAVPVSLAGPSRRSGAAGRARPGTIVSGRDDERVRGLGRRSSCGRSGGPSMAQRRYHRARGGSTGPRPTAPDRSGPLAVRGRTINMAVEWPIRWSHRAIGHLSSAASSPAQRRRTHRGTRTMEVTQDILLPVLRGRDRREHGDPGVMVVVARARSRHSVAAGRRRSVRGSRPSRHRSIGLIAVVDDGGSAGAADDGAEAAVDGGRRIPTATARRSARGASVGRRGRRGALRRRDADGVGERADRDEPGAAGRRRADAGVDALTGLMMPRGVRAAGRRRGASGSSAITGRRRS